MPRDIITLSAADLPEGVKMGSNVALALKGQVIDATGSKVMIEVRRISASQSGITGRFDEMAAILGKINRNVSESAKVKPLGNS